MMSTSDMNASLDAATGRDKTEYVVAICVMAHMRLDGRVFGALRPNDQISRYRNASAVDDN